jgi:holo-ACP synthase/triphosphoribosyl-dephospho-CoA synthase
MSHALSFLAKRSQEAASLAKTAMTKEVMLTPKPGLVDQNNNGSHKDMNLQTFFTSIEAIEPYLKRFIEAGISHPNTPKECFKELRNIGIECEKSMFEATKGVNTHKGMIFSLAVILGSFGQVLKTQKLITPRLLHNQIKTLCSDLMYQDFAKIAKNPSAGERFYKLYGNGGIRQEAQNGYPTLFSISLPIFHNHLKFGEDIALQMSLLALMQNLQDSTLWARGAEDGLNYVQNYAKSFNGNPHDISRFLKKMDEDLIIRHLSPGGSADLLAMTYLIHGLIANS